MPKTRVKRFALDLGASSVKACELTQTSSGLQLTKFTHINLGIEPSMPPEEKEALKLEGIGRALKAGNFKHRRVIFAVPGQSVFVRNRLLPPVQESRLAQIVQYEIQQQIPFPLSQIALDYQVIKRTETKEYDVMMTAIKVDTVDSFADVILNSRLKIDAVDVAPVATFNWLRFSEELSKEEGETTACIDIGASTTDIFVERNGEFRFTRSLTIAGNHITEAIKDALSVPFEEAERLKITIGRAPVGAEGPPDPHTQEGKVATVIDEVLGRLAHEINRSFGFFRTQSGGSPVARAVLCGGSAALKNIEQYMVERLEVPVALANPLKKLAIAPTAATAQAVPHLLSTCLGLALRNVTRCPLEINLIPPRIIEAEKRKERGVYWGLCFFTLILIGMSVIPIRAQQYRYMKQEQTLLDTRIKTYTDNDDERKALEAELDDYKQKYKLLNQMASVADRWTWLVPLEEICKAVPKGVWLDQMATIELVEGAASAGPSRFGLTGFSGVGIPPGALSARSRRDEDRGASAFRAGYSGLATGGTMTIPKVNGVRISGYAENPRQIEEFKEAIEKVPMFNKVILYTTAITQVDKFSLQRTGTAGTYGAARGMYSDDDARHERRGMSFGGLFGGAYTGRQTAGYGYGYQTPQLTEQNQVYSFTMDVGLPL